MPANRSAAWIVTLSAASLLLLQVQDSWALGPHELLLLVNSSSPWSRELAQRYAALHGVPPENVVDLDLPDTVMCAEGEISTNEFAQYILEPVWKTIRERRLEGRVVAWAYSADFPVRVRANPAVSLHGMTFVQGQLPPSGVIVTGLFASVFFRGPAGPGRPAGPTLSMDVWTRAAMPIWPVPSMSLAWSGARGLDRTETRAWLSRVATAQTSTAWKSHEVWLVTGPDIRAHTREWQFEFVARELGELGVRCRVTSNAPGSGRMLSGLMLGEAKPVVQRWGRLGPGAIADHLTSFAAVFHNPDQTKLTEWLRHGAAAAAGTVVEPYSIWTKFPHARIFSHLAHGVTVLEAYYQAVACPLQLFIVGDPLLAPAQPSLPVTIQAECTNGWLRATLMPEPPGEADRVLWFLDGALAQQSTNYTWQIEDSRLSKGWHRLRGVVYRGDQVRRQGFAECEVWVPGGPELSIVKPSPNSVLYARRTNLVEVVASSPPKFIALYCNGRKIAEAASPSTPRFALVIPPRTLAAGPIQCTLAGWWDGPGLIRSATVRYETSDSNSPPIVDGPVRLAPSGRWAANIQDPDADPVRVSWWQACDPSLDRFESPEAKLRRSSRGWRTEATGTNSLATVLWPIGRESRGFALEWIPASLSEPRRDIAGLLVQCGTNSPIVMFFGWMGDLSAWVLGRVEGSHIRRLASRGWPNRPTSPVTLVLIQTSEDTWEGLVNGTQVVRWKTREWTHPECLGCAANDAGQEFGAFRVEVHATQLENGMGAAEGPEVTQWVRAYDGEMETWKKIE